MEGHYLILELDMSLCNRIFEIINIKYKSQAARAAVQGLGRMNEWDRCLKMLVLSVHITNVEILMMLPFFLLRKLKLVHMPKQMNMRPNLQNGCANAWSDERWEL